MAAPLTLPDRQLAAHSLCALRQAVPTGPARSTSCQLPHGTSHVPTHPESGSGTWAAASALRHWGLLGHGASLLVSPSPGRAPSIPPLCISGLVPPSSGGGGSPAPAAPEPHLQLTLPVKEQPCRAQDPAAPRHTAESSPAGVCMDPQHPQPCGGASEDPRSRDATGAASFCLPVSGVCSCFALLLVNASRLPFCLRSSGALGRGSGCQRASLRVRWHLSGHRIKHTRLPC